MNCPHCNVHIDKHPASRCLDAWVAEAVMEWKPYFIISYNILYPPGRQSFCDEHPVLYGNYRSDKPYEFDSEHFYNSGETPPFTQPIVISYSTDISVAKKASDKAGHAVIFAPHSSVLGDYANRKNEWMVEMIPLGGTTENGVRAYGKTESLARCRAAIKTSQ